MTTLTAEIALLDRAVRGDSLALEGLLVLHADQLLAYIRRHLPAPLAAAYEPRDVLQDVCVEVCRRIQDFNSADPKSFTPWLLTIARHHMIGLVREAKAKKRGGGWRRCADGDPDDSAVISALDALAVFYRTPSASAMSHEAAAAVQASIDRLASDYRDAIRLRHVEGLSAKDAAARMNRTEGAFHLLCHRGLQKLRQDLKSKSFFV